MKKIKRLDVIKNNRRKACVAQKIDNKKMRRALERGNILLVNEVMNDYNSKNIPKNRRNERFKIRDRLIKKLLERKTNQKFQSEIVSLFSTVL